MTNESSWNSCSDEAESVKGRTKQISGSSVNSLISWFRCLFSAPFFFHFPRHHHRHHHHHHHKKKTNGGETETLVPDLKISSEVKKKKKKKVRRPKPKPLGWILCQTSTLCDVIWTTTYKPPPPPPFHPQLARDFESLDDLWDQQSADSEEIAELKQSIMLERAKLLQNSTGGIPITTKKKKKKKRRKPHSARRHQDEAVYCLFEILVFFFFKIVWLFETPENWENEGSCHKETQQCKASAGESFFFIYSFFPPLFWLNVVFVSQNVGNGDTMRRNPSLHRLKTVLKDKLQITAPSDSSGGPKLARNNSSGFAPRPSYIRNKVAPKPKEKQEKQEASAYVQSSPALKRKNTALARLQDMLANQADVDIFDAD